MSKWIEWKGGDRPVPAETIVAVKFRYEASNGMRPSGDARAESLRWHHSVNWVDSLGDIIAYRIIKEGEE